MGAPPPGTLTTVKLTELVASVISTDSGHRVNYRNDVHLHLTETNRVASAVLRPGVRMISAITSEICSKKTGPVKEVAYA